MSGLVASIRRRQDEGWMPVLAEIKVRSPKEGDLLGGRAPEDLARIYDAQPAAGISVVTEPHDFGGEVAIIARIRSLTDLPILRKDFPRGVADLEETARAGAQAQLLTVRMLDPELLTELHDVAQAMGLETLVEVHDSADVELVRELGLRPDVLGINNRDIVRGETDDGDVSLTERLAAVLPPDVPILSESAIAGAADARRARDAGADAVLVGTAILTAVDPAAMIAELAGVGWRR